MADYGLRRPPALTVAVWIDAGSRFGDGALIDRSTEAELWRGGFGAVIRRARSRIAPIHLEGLMTSRYLSTATRVIACAVISFITAAHAAETAAQQAGPGISKDAEAAVQQMGRTLTANDMSFKVRTIRVYQDEAGDFLHIGHNMNIVVRRPDRLAVKATGDDGTTQLFYDGKTASVLNLASDKYAQVGVPPKLEAMLDEVMDKLQVDFPLADFLADEPGKSFLTEVTSGKVVNTVTIDGTPCSHLLFSQSGGIELELWVEKNDKTIPRRMIATYRSLPGQPSFIAEFSDWNFNAHPADTEFVFHPPAGATKVDLAVAVGSERGSAGGK